MRLSLSTFLLWLVLSATGRCAAVLTLGSALLTSNGQFLTAIISGGSGAGYAPATGVSGLTVTSNGLTHPISSSAISGNTLLIQLSAPISRTASRVRLAIGVGSNLTDSGGNTAQGQTAVSVTNNSTQLLRLASTRGQWPGTNLSNGTDTALNSRVTMIVPFVSSGLSIIYPDAFGVGEGTGGGLGSFTITAAIEYNGAAYPATWAGASSFTFAPGQMVISDPVVDGNGVILAIPQGATIYIRTHLAIVTPGQKWPLGLVYSEVSTDGYESGSTGASQIDKSDETGPLTANPFATGFSPLAVIGQTNGPASAVCLYGDSIMAGQGVGSQLNYGFVVVAINPTYPYAQLAVPGESALNMNANSLRMALAQNCSAAVIEYATNDFANGQTLAQTQASLLVIWNGLNNAGTASYQTTITPRTTSTDSFETVVNQTAATPSAAFGPTGYRTQLNDWLRDGAPISGGVAVPVGTVSATRMGQAGHPLKGYFDVSTLVESSFDSGFWAPNASPNYLTGDGTHPTGTAYNLIASMLPFVSQFFPYVGGRR